jgi:hypothetical protein
MSPISLWSILCFSVSGICLLDRVSNNVTVGEFGQ